jgi:two-component system cell cycle response regulator
MTRKTTFGIYPIHGEDADTLMKSPDLALYEAKRAGKNVYRIAERTDLSAAARGYAPQKMKGPMNG